LGAWRVAGQDVQFHWLCEGQTYDVRAYREATEPGTWRLVSGQIQYTAVPAPNAEGSVLLESLQGREHCLVASSGVGTWVSLSGIAWRIEKGRPPGLGSHVRSALAGGSRSLEAPMPGIVAKINVAEGDTVTAHQVVVVLEAMKMEHALEAPGDGIVRRLHCKEGDLVPAGARLIDLEGAGPMVAGQPAPEADTLGSAPGAAPRDGAP
jgi:biotin carboxyl carrier protein